MAFFIACEEVGDKGACLRVPIEGKESPLKLTSSRKLNYLFTYIFEFYVIIWFIDFEHKQKETAFGVECGVNFCTGSGNITITEQRGNFTESKFGVKMIRFSAFPEESSLTLDRCDYFGSCRGQKHSFKGDVKAFFVVPKRGNCSSYWLGLNLEVSRSFIVSKTRMSPTRVLLLNFFFPQRPTRERPIDRRTEMGEQKVKSQVANVSQTSLTPFKLTPPSTPKAVSSTLSRTEEADNV